MTEQTQAEHADTNEHEDDAPVTVADKPREPSEYEKKLRTEARRLRTRHEDAVKEHQTALAKVTSEFEAKLAARETAARDREVMAELKLHAAKAGVVDPDVLALLDRKAAKFDETGVISNAAELVEAFRAAKPALFSASTSVSNPAPKPKATTDTKIDFAAMTPGERKAFERNVLNIR